MRSLRTRVALVLLVSLAGVTGCGEPSRNADEPAGAVCGALGEKRHADAIALSDDAAQDSKLDPRVGACRCWAQLHLGRVAECADWIESDAPSSTELVGLRVATAQALVSRGDPARARRVLGDRPPPFSHPHALGYWEEQARAIATQGDVSGLRRHFEKWRALGGDPDELRARYALRISVSLLRDPQYGEVELLERALAGAASLDARLHWALSRRLIGALLAERRIDEALSVYDEASRVVTFPELDREEIERYRLAGSNGQVEQNVETGSLLFRLEADASVTGELLVSPSLRMPVDLDYEAHALSPGSSVKVERREAITPQRWVFRDSAGSVRASGTIWPVADRTVEVEIAIREPSLEPAPAATPVLEPGDGRRRLFVLVLDCADWRLIQYLRTRRELPQIEALLAEGYRAVLESSPAFTGAAMEALVWPTQQPRVSLLGLLQRMGLELGALASVGRNPLGFLAAVLPQRDSLFEVVGAGERVAANLLFSHGGIDAGRHAELQGPNGERRQLEFSHYARPLREDEWEGFSDFDWAPPHRRHLETIAAEFDATREIIENGDTDLLLMRIEPLDLVTHVFFRSLLQGDQDDGVNPLLDTYRYIDSRLAEIRAALDADDGLIVMSDHGIRTPMEHEEDAFFVFTGPGVPRGRATGTPHLRGVPRVLASWMGVENAWPDSGLAPWLWAAESDPDASAAEDALAQRAESPGRI